MHLTSTSDGSPVAVLKHLRKPNHVGGCVGLFSSATKEASPRALSGGPGCCHPGAIHRPPAHPGSPTAASPSLPIQVPRASLKVTDYTVHDAQSIGAELKVSTASVHQTRCALKRLEGQEVGGFRCATISTDVKTHSQPSLPAKVLPGKLMWDNHVANHVANPVGQSCGTIMWDVL